MADQPLDPEDAKRTASQEDKQDEGEPVIVKFSPEEEADLVSEFNQHKAQANSLFVKGSYDQALNKYAEANSALPNYLDYELAVLQSNVSACHLKLKEWKEAITSATTSLDRLDKLDAEIALDVKAAEDAFKKKNDEAFGNIEDEIVSAGASQAAPTPSVAAEDDPDASARTQKQTDIKRIRYKASMRRARARSELGGWQNLEGAHADYTALQKMDNLTAADRKLVAAQLKALPARITEAKERETAQMWDQLKQLGNGILKPFGLSTDSFQMQQDPKTGGYSMNMKSG